MPGYIYIEGRQSSRAKELYKDPKLGVRIATHVASLVEEGVILVLRRRAVVVVVVIVVVIAETMGWRTAAYDDIAKSSLTLCVIYSVEKICRGFFLILMRKQQRKNKEVYIGATIWLLEGEGMADVGNDAAHVLSCDSWWQTGSKSLGT